jgi:hypothetical protein
MTVALDLLLNLSLSRRTTAHVCPVRWDFQNYHSRLGEIQTFTRDAESYS